jgi:uncharacterized membrane protein
MEDFRNVLTGDIKSEAKRRLAGNWGKGVLIVLIYFAINLTMAFVPIIGSLASMVISGPIALGIHVLILKLIRTGDADIENMFDGFKDFGQAFLIALLRAVFIMLWGLLAVIPMVAIPLGASFGNPLLVLFMLPLALLLSIPAFMAYYGYAMVFFVKIDHPELSAMEVLSRSKEMMLGYKMKLFLLNLSFIGWILLASFFTIGIGYFWLTPYMMVSNGIFYSYLSNQAQPFKKVIDEFEEY